MTDRVTFLVDGFNVYHSIKQSLTDGVIARGKWLDLRALCGSFISVFGTDAVLEDVYYFSALAHHTDPGNVAKHQAYISALNSSGVKAILGQFKRKQVRCS